MSIIIVLVIKFSYKIFYLKFIFIIIIFNITKYLILIILIIKFYNYNNKIFKFNKYFKFWLGIGQIY
jgi:hypothetical protein